MKIKRLGLFVLLITLAACAPQATPSPAPAQPSPGSVGTPGAYPPPVVTQSVYPGPDDPVSSGGVSPGSPVSPGPYPSPLEPIAGEDSMTRGEVFIDEMQILTMESFPPLFLLQISGSLPTPCHHLRADMSEPDAQNRIMVEVYSLTDPDTACIQVLEPFQQGINLGSLPQGSYTVLVNGEQVAEIEAP